MNRTLTMAMAALIWVGSIWGAGLQSTSPAYEVASFLGDAKYAYWDAVRWEALDPGGTIPVRRQQYLVISGAGEIEYFEFVGKPPEGGGHVLAPTYYDIILTQRVKLDVAKIQNLRAALRSLTAFGVFPLRMAGTRDTVAIFTPGAICIALSESELKDWNDGLLALRSAMKRGGGGEEISEICAKYWGAPILKN